MDLAPRRVIHRVRGRHRSIRLRRHPRERWKLAHTRGETVPRLATTLRSWFGRCSSIGGVHYELARGSG
jgi:hypothetical protein